MQFIDLNKQYAIIKDDVQKQINEVLDSGQFIMGNKIPELEAKLAEYVGVKHAIGVSDGTKALLLALMALDIKPGDEVIVPAFTFIATASMVALLGAVPIFVDIDIKTYNMDPDLLEAAITSKTKAIIPVSLYGQCADLPSINVVADKHGIAVIEDSGQGFGSSLDDKRSCSMTTIACTSFFPSKPLGCYGDGGACFTNDDKLAERIRQMRVHGQDSRYHHALLGINGRLDTLQAAVLLAKFKVLDQELELRQKVGARYTELLKDLNCTVPSVVSGAKHVYAQYSILVNNRDEFIKKLHERGVPTAVHYPIPLHQQPALAQYVVSGLSLPISEMAAQKVLSLPMYPYMDEATQDFIVDAVKESL